MPAVPRHAGCPEEAGDGGAEAGEGAEVCRVAGGTRWPGEGMGDEQADGAAGVASLGAVAVSKSPAAKDGVARAGTPPPLSLAPVAVTVMLLA